jgi:hypothetical protein
MLVNATIEIFPLNFAPYFETQPISVFNATADKLIKDLELPIIMDLNNKTDEVSV